MSKKQFGIWMDSRNATIVGRDLVGHGDYTFIANVTSEDVTHSTSEKNEHNQEKTYQGKFFKEILTHMQNAESVHVTGTGVAQEQFIHHLADTAQFKNVKTAETTSNKMSPEKLIEYFQKN